MESFPAQICNVGCDKSPISLIGHYSSHAAMAPHVMMCLLRYAYLYLWPPLIMTSCYFYLLTLAITMPCKLYMGFHQICSSFTVIT